MSVDRGIFDCLGAAMAGGTRPQETESVVVHQQRQKASCVFDDQRVIGRQLVYTDGKYWNVLQSITPAAPGHLLVIPIRHIQCDHERSEEEGAALTAVSKQCAAVFKKLYGVDYLVIQKNGRLAGQSVFHLHYHYVPMTGQRLAPVVSQVFGEKSRLTDAQLQREVAKLSKGFIDVRAQEIAEKTDLKTTLESAAAALENGRDEEAYISIRQLQAADKAIAGRIFGKIWELAGKPTAQTHPKIAHPKFGEVAFFGKEGRSVTRERKIAALKEIAANLSRPCVFDEAVMPDTQRVYSDGRDWEVLHSLTPAVPGHLIVIPRRRIQYDHERSPEEGASLTMVSKKCATAFERLYGDNYIVIQKNGVGAGQAIPQLQYHYIPMTGDLSLSEVISKVFVKLNPPLTPDQMRQGVETLQGAFSDIEVRTPTRALAAPSSVILDQLERMITPKPSEINVGIKWQLECLAQMMPDAMDRIQALLKRVAKVDFRSELPKCYPRLVAVDKVFGPLALPFSSGRDRHDTVRPYAFNQVLLHNGTGMNASRICFPQDSQPYPSAETYCYAMSAPMPGHELPTLQMYAEQNIGLIINLTEFREGDMKKADRYLRAEHGDEIRGDGYILKNYAKETVDLSISGQMDKRSMDLEIAGTRHLFQEFHFRQWKDFSAPDTAALIQLLEHIIEFKRSRPGQNIAIHCSGGVGRTGVLIAAAKIYELLLEGKDPDVKKIVTQLRLQRGLLGGLECQYQALWEIKRVLQEKTR